MKGVVLGCGALKSVGFGSGVAGLEIHWVKLQWSMGRGQQ